MKEYSIKDAFKALEGIDDIIVEEVKSRTLTEAESYNLNDTDDIEAAQAFMDAVVEEEPIEQIVDVEAETFDDLKDSYVGEMILQCPVCHEMIYKNEEDLVAPVEEDDLYNVEEVCPNCGAEGGFELIGKVAPVEEVKDEEPEDLEEPVLDDEVEEEPVVEDKPEEEKPEEVEEEPVELESKEVKDEKEQLTESSDSDKIEKFLKANELNIDGGIQEEELKEEKIEDEPEEEKAEEVCPECGKNPCECVKDDSLEECDLHEDVCPNCGKNPCVCEKCECEEECKDCKDEDCKDGKCLDQVFEEHEESLEEAFSEFDEESFDTLINKYLNETYENVESYKTVDGTLDNNNLIVEGVIKFKSGKEQNTKFVFESKMEKDKPLRLTGMNESFTNAKKAFTLKVDGSNRILKCENLRYNYKVNQLNESKESEPIIVSGRVNLIQK